MGLIHYPVLNKRGEKIASAVTNLDLHDIARAAKTYGVRGFYVITPLEDQLELTQKIVDHWTKGPGADYNPSRKTAMDLIHIKESLEAALADILQQEDSQPLTIATCARSYKETKARLRFKDLKTMLKTGQPMMLNFGTAWGLTEQFLEESDYLVEALQSDCEYNHLSVRSAAAIMLDRVLAF